MAPERARGERVGPAADVFALGAVLYTLLTGRPPFQGSTPVETLEQVRSQEAVPPRRLTPGVPRDLETVCQKCLEKDPRRRYPTAGRLADDLGRYLAGRPILARPVGLLQRAVRRARRRPTEAGLWAAVVLVTAVAFALVAWQWWEAVDQGRRADERAEAEARSRALAERYAAGLVLDQGITLGEQRDVGAGLPWLLRALERSVELGAADLEHAARANLALWRPWLVRERARFAHASWVWAAFTPDGRTVLTGCRRDPAAPAQLWDGRTGRPLGAPLPHRFGVRAVALGPGDGTLALTGSGTVEGNEGEARLWAVPSGEPRGEPVPLAGSPLQVAFAPPDGGAFLTVCPAEARVWDAATARPRGTPLRHPGPLRAAVFSPDGRFVATAGDDGTARLWDADTGRLVHTFGGHTGPVLAVAFHPDGSRVVTGSEDGTARLWRAGTGAAAGEPLVHLGPVAAVAFAGDGRVVATGCEVKEGLAPTVGAPPPATRGEARLWDADTGAPRGAPLSHPQPVRSLALSPGGRVLLTGCQDRKARFFHTATGTLIGPTREHGGSVATAAFSRDGRLALTAALGGDRPDARVWELPPEAEDGRPLPTPLPVDHLAFGPAGILASASRFRGETRLWDVAAGPRPVRVLAHADGHGICGVAFQEDGRLLTAGYEGVCRLWDVGTGAGRQLVPGPGLIRAAAAGRDGRTVFLGYRGGAVRRYRLDTGEPVGPVLEHDDAVWGLAVSLDGRTVLTGSRDRSARLWDPDTGRLLHRWEHEDRVDCVAYHPSGRLLLTAAPRRPPRLWDAATFAPVRSPLAQRLGPVESAAFAPDGRTVLTGNAEGEVRLWDLTTGKPLGPPLPHPDRVLSVAFRGDGRLIATGCQDNHVRIWPLPAPVEGPPARVRLWVEALTGCEAADDGVRELGPEALRGRREQLARTPGVAD
jgi:WD40 repeat protein